MKWPNDLDRGRDHSHRATKRNGSERSLLGDIGSLIETTGAAVSPRRSTRNWSCSTGKSRPVSGRIFCTNRRSRLWLEIVPHWGDNCRNSAGLLGKGIAAHDSFCRSYPNARIVSALRRQLNWTHIRYILYLPDPLQRTERGKLRFDGACGRLAGFERVRRRLERSDGAVGLSPTSPPFWVRYPRFSDTSRATSANDSPACRREADGGSTCSAISWPMSPRCFSIPS